MALKLGELLIGRGLLTPEQLGQALQGQSIFGGKLGTNLVEMGFVTEDQIAATLSQQLSLPCARPQWVANIPKDVIATVPKELAERYRAIPLKKDGRELHVGLADPQNLERVDELVFALGVPVRPYVITEVTLNYALERYYGIRRETRYLRLGGTEPAELRLTTIAEEVERQRRQAAPPPAGSAAPPPPPGGAAPSSAAARSVTPPPVTAVGARPPSQSGAASVPHASQSAAAAAAARRSVTPPPMTIVSPPPITGVGAAPTTVTGPPSGVVPAPGAGSGASTTGTYRVPSPIAAPPGPIGDLLLRLANVMSDADFLDIVFQYLVRVFDEVAILVPRGELAHGVVMGNRKERRPYAGALTAPCVPGTLLAEVMGKAQLVYRAELADPGLLALCQAGGIATAKIAIVPIFDNRVPVLIALGQGRDQNELRGKVEELRTFLAKASCAFQIIALRKQILTQ